MSERLTRAALRVLDKYHVAENYLLCASKSFLYQRYENGHVFDIEVDDLKFQMAFPDTPIGVAIVERIEGRREPEQTAVIKSLVRPGDRVLELGGAYGYFTTIMSHCAGPTGKVVSIEGTPNNFTVLQGNIARNGLRNVDAYNLFILSSDEKPVTFFRDDREPFYDAIRRLDGEPAKSNGARQQVDVRPVKLSKFLREIDFVPDRVFMDIEGFEVDVFEDLAPEFLRRHRPTIFFEEHPTIYQPGRDLPHVLQLVRGAGYYCRKVAGAWLCIPEPA